MGGADPRPQENTSEAGLMRAGARTWIRRTGHDLRGISGPALLSALCAAAFCPLIAVGVTGAAAVAGIGVLSSVGGGVLTDVIIKAIDRLRGSDAEDPAAPPAIEQALAEGIGKVLAAGAAQAAELRAEIGTVLGQVDLGGALLREAIESGDERLRTDLIAAIGALGSDFAELGFLIKDVAAAAARIQQDLDEQRASTQVIIEQNAGQSAEIRRVREDLAVIERLTRPGPRAGDGSPAAAARWEGSPYRGLLPFSEADEEIFYGRERVTTELAILAAEQASRGGLIVVGGASGAGKSSLLRAGLLPALARGLQVQGSARWPRLVMTPTRAPLTELATQLAAVSGVDLRSLEDTLTEDPDLARAAARQAALASAARYPGPPAAGDPRLVLIVDQFEQVFTLGSGPDQADPDQADPGQAGRQARFVTALHAMTTNPGGDPGAPPALVVLAVRGDFLDRCSGFAELAAAVRDHQLFMVEPMTSSELRLAITGPAAAAGLHLEPALTETVLGDLRAAGPGNAAGQLPLLSQAMLLTWENRDGDRLTLHGYGQSGGISDAVGTSADAAYDSLPPAGQGLARKILRHMITASRDAQPARRPVTRTALYGLPGGGQARTDEVLERFAARRLIVLNDGGAEIAHDALLTAWPRLREWLAEDRASWVLHSQLADDAEAWRRDRPPDFLYRGTQLAAVRHAADTWATDADRYPTLSGTETDFLDSSQRADRRRIRQRRTAIVALLILLAASLTGAGLAIAAARNANYQRTLAASDQLAAESEQLDATDPVTAAQLAAASWAVLPTPAARASMLEVLAQGDIATIEPEPNGSVTSVAYSPDGRILAVAEGDGTVSLWDAATRQQIGASLDVQGNADVEVVAVAFSPNGKLLATASGDGTVRLWDVATHQQIEAIITVVPGSEGSSSDDSVAFSPDGRILAAAADNGTVRLWDLAMHQQVGAPIVIAPVNGNSPGGVSAVAFSPDGRMLATGGSDGTARLWDVATHRQIGSAMAAVPSASAVGGTSFGITGVTGVAFSPGGGILVTGGSDGMARLWDVATHHEIGTPVAAVSDPPVNAVNGVAFSPDGAMFATAGGDGTARLWDVATLQEIGAPLTAARDGAVNAVVFSPDGDDLTTAGEDGTVRLWSPDFYGQVGAPVGTASGAVEVADVAINRDGILATEGWDGIVQLWNAVTHRQIGTPLASSDRTFGFPHLGVFDLAFSPDGRILAGVEAGGTIRLWDTVAHRQVGQPIPAGVVDAFGYTVDAVAFSPSGSLLATAGSNGQVRLWDVATHREVGLPIRVPASAVTDVAFSPDGSVLATVGGDGRLRLWDVATHREIGAPIPAVGDPASNEVSAVAFSPDGSLLATASADGTVRLWDTATRQQIGAPLAAASYGAVNAVAFSPDGQILATASADGTVRLWDTDTRQQIGADINLGDNYANALAFSPDGRLLATVGSDGTARLWDVGFPANLPAAVCAAAGSGLTPAQWTLYVQSVSYQPTCP